MAYDEELAERVRTILGPRGDVTERNMFGSRAFMVAGNMAVCVVADGLLVRVEHDDTERVLAEPHVREFDMTGRTMRGFVLVDARGIATDDELTRWIDHGSGVAAALPPKG
jgi:TfoX/Sxy family transcriptional regulator of competence genes